MAATVNSATLLEGAVRRTLPGALQLQLNSRRIQKEKKAK
jgi:hypothetical protein